MAQIGKVFLRIENKGQSWLGPLWKKSKAYEVAMIKWSFLKSKMGLRKAHKLRSKIKPNKWYPAELNERIEKKPRGQAGPTQYCKTWQTQEARNVLLQGIRMNSNLEKINMVKQHKVTLNSSRMCMRKKRNKAREKDEVERLCGPATQPMHKWGKAHSW